MLIYIMNPEEQEQFFFEKYISGLQFYLQTLRPTGHLVGPNGTYTPENLFTNYETLPAIDSYFRTYIEINKRFNNHPQIRVLISNIQQVILAYYSLMNRDARELNIQIFAMPWDEIISGEIDLTNPQINSSNPFTVRSITRRTLGGRTKKRRNKRRRTLRRKRTYK